MANPDEQKGIILAIEAAIGGGSIAIVKDSNMMAGSSGGGSVSRAEDLLLTIDGVLKNAEIDKSDITSIAVSLGPGSFTGLRIGLSTAMGFAAALGAPCIGVPLFDAIAAKSASTLAVVVPLGRSDLCYGLYGNGKLKDDFSVGSIDDFVSFLRVTRPERIARHPAVDLSKIEDAGIEGVVLFNVGPNLAEYIGKYESATGSTGSLDPIYVRNPRFA